MGGGGRCYQASGDSPRNVGEQPVRRQISEYHYHTHRLENFRSHSYLLRLVIDYIFSFGCYQRLESLTALKPLITALRIVAELFRWLRTFLRNVSTPSSALDIIVQAQIN
jgi:hypothetical protein